MASKGILIPKSLHKFSYNYNIPAGEESHWELESEIPNEIDYIENLIHNIHWESSDLSFCMPEYPENTNKTIYYLFWTDFIDTIDSNILSNSISWEASYLKTCTTNQDPNNYQEGFNWEVGTLCSPQGQCCNNNNQTPNNPDPNLGLYLLKTNYLNEFSSPTETQNVRTNLSVLSNEEILTLLAEYIKKDGTTPFLARQKGIEAIESDELVTLSQLNNISISTENDIITNTNDGTILAGTLIPAGTSLEDYIRLRGVTYLIPTFSSFSSGITGLQEIGSVITSNTFSWNTTNQSNINNNSISITLQYTNPATPETTLFTSLTKSGTQIYNGNLQVATKRNILFNIKGINTQSNLFTSQTSITFAFKQYYGESLNNSLTSSDVISLRGNTVKNSVLGDYIFNPLINGYKWLVFSSELVQPSNFVDPNNANTPVLMQPGVIISVTNSFGVIQDYIAYRSTNQLGGSITIRVI